MEPFYKISRKIRDDLDLYRLEVERFNKGEVSAAKLRPFRVARGVYAQRGQTRFMVRIKVPGGGLTPDQMVEIADLSEKYGNGVPHITTRQDIQLHYVTLDDTVNAIEGLLKAGLTTRGGGGNTVRNVTACYAAGICNEEVFDVSPYAPAFTEFFLNHPKAFNLPRKFKIAFSGCSDDCSLATINDVGFIAKKKVVDGKEVRGFRVYAAGGMGAKSRVADLLEDFVPEEEAIYVAEAIMILFDKHGNRKNKHKARLRFVIDRVGREEFLKMYQAELKAVKAGGPKNINLRDRPAAEGKQLSKTHVQPDIIDAGFEAWRKSNVLPQKQGGFYYAKIRTRLGDIDAESFRKMADIVRTFGEGSIRTTHDQNIVVRWLGAGELYPFYKALDEIGFSSPGAGKVSDILCCPGASTCNLGICLSRNMSKELEKELESDDLDLESMDDVRIMLSGCHNSCGQHPIGPIGFHGVARRGEDKRMAPHYNVLLGGRVEEGKTTLSEEIGFVPAKKVPALVKKFLREYTKNRAEGEDFYSYLDRIGKTAMKALIKEHNLPSYEEDSDCYKDWGSDEEFSLAGLGPGECGAGVLDIIEADIDDGRRNIYLAEKEVQAGNPAAASEALARAIGLTTKSLLVTKGVEPTDDYISVTEFENYFVKTGLLPQKFSNLKKRWAGYISGLLNKEGVKEDIVFMEQFSKAVADLYDGMDANMKFQGETIKEKQEPSKTTSAQTPKSAAKTDAAMDLRGVKCPINYVKAKIRLEMMAEGQTLQLLLDDGEPIRNVPTSLKNDGQEILKMEKTGEYFELVVKKAA